MKGAVLPDPHDDLQVPPAIALVRDFVNTREPQTGAEDLGTPASLRDWCAARGLVAVGAGLSAADLQRAITVREGLRAVLLRHAGHEASGSAVAHLNQVFAEVPVTAAFDESGYRLVPVAPGPFPEILAALGDAIRQASEDRTWHRLKVCARDSCRWAFYDASKNQARRWCSMAGCGNHVKMKRAYARRTRPA